MAGVTSQFQDTLAVLLASNHNSNPTEMETSCNDTTDNSSEFEDETNEPYDLSMPRVMKTESPKSTNDQAESSHTSAEFRAKPRERNITSQQNGVSDHPSSHTNDIENDQKSLSANSMLQGMNEMRHRRILCDVLFCLEGERDVREPPNKVERRYKTTPSIHFLGTPRHSKLPIGNRCFLNYATTAQKEFYAHKAVMASCSEYCREKFFTDNSLAQENLTIINLALPPNGFYSLLDFVYTNTLKMDDLSVFHILQAAKILKIHKLVEACNEYITKHSTSPDADSLSSQKQVQPTTCNANSPDHPHSTSPRDLCLKVESNSSIVGCADKPRRASDSITSVRELSRKDRSAPFENRSGWSSTKEMTPIQHSKSEGEPSNTDSHKVADVGSRLKSHSDLLNASATFGSLYQPVHWKGHQFIRSEQQKVRSHSETALSNGPYDEVFSEIKTSETPNDTTEQSDASRSSSPTSLVRSANKNYFTFDFNTRQNQIRNMFPMPTYPDFSNINAFPSLFGYRFGTGSIFDNPLSYFGNSVQGHDLNAARTTRDIYPLLTPGRNPGISHHFRSSLRYTAPDQAMPLKTTFENRFAPNNRTISLPATTTDNSTLLGEAKRRRKANSVDFQLSSTTNRNEVLRKYSSSSENKTSPINSVNGSSPETQVQHLASKQFKKGEAGKPYKCPLCDANFNRPANLKTHMRIHSGEKPYKCDNCGARFVQVAHLRAHVLIHTGEKPYPCSVCGTRFRHLQTLKSHLRIHTGEKPYSCEQCSVQFRHKSQLRLHLRTKHGIQTNTKKTYKQVPGLCSADICAHIKRAQEAVKTQGQTKFGTVTETANNSRFFADEKDSNGEEVPTTKCRSDDATTSPTALNLNSLFKISVRGRLESIPENGHLTNVPSLNIGQGVGLDLKVV